MILIIDTTTDDFFTIALAKCSGILVSKKNIRGRFIQAERLLPSIDKLLKSKKIAYTKLSGISVVRGPAGFTAIRIAVITANTLAYALKIPMVGFKTSEFTNIEDLVSKSVLKLKKIKKYSIIRPYYGRPPNITKSKRKLY